MTKKNKKIPKITIAFFIIVVSLIIFIIINYEKNNILEKDVLVSNESNEELTNVLKEVSNSIEYFRVKNCIDKYYRMLGYISGGGEYSNQVFSLLSEEYIERFNITEDNILEVINLEYKEYLITKMYKKDISEKLHIYLVYGKNINNEQNFESIDYGLIIKIDETNSTFSIYLNNYLEENNLLDLYEGDTLEIENINNIPNRDFNVYYEDDIDISQESQVKYYFEIYKKYIAIDLENTYNILDADYRNIRFENIEEYIEYMYEKVQEITSATIESYQFNRYTKYIQIICIDKNENYYIFNVTNPGVFNIMLDDYTVLLATNEAEYEEAFPKAKCEYNIERFIKGINDKNYNFSYSVLNESSKTIEYATKKSFIEYIENNLFDENEINYEDFTMLEENLYTYTVKLTDKSKSDSREIDMTFTINLISNNKFEISFTIN